MKTLKVITAFLVQSIFILTLCIGSISCEGPEGPEGEMGLQGPSGQDGNANVTVKTVDNVVWTEGNFLGRTANTFVINDTDINQEVLDNSLILVYFQLDGTDIWYPMSYSYPYSNGDSEIITFTYSLNTLSIYALRTSGPLNAVISRIKYVIIEGTTVSGSIDLNNFDEVQSHYGLD